jgi:hypothetical protein
MSDLDESGQRLELGPVERVFESALDLMVPGRGEKADPLAGEAPFERSRGIEIGGAGPRKSFGPPDGRVRVPRE